uniref:NOP protein chaperone 1 n=1 Tax=Nothobranchius furzeri TaxID=105023 RepID=A0A8C6P2P3_NOTFU
MDQNAKKTTSRSLLSCGNEGALSEKLLLKRKAGKSLKTERVPRSSMLERLQNFLPQMAEANMKLTQQMEKAPPGHFDIENVDKAEKVIEMVSTILFLLETSEFKHQFTSNNNRSYHPTADFPFHGGYLVCDELIHIELELWKVSEASVMRVPSCASQIILKS